MNPRIVVTGLGVVSPAGVGSALLFSALTSGTRLIAPLDAGWAAAPFQHGAPVRETGARGRIPAGRLRRMGRLSQMAAVAAADALEQSGPGQPTETGVVLGTGFGALEETVAFIAELASLGAAGANPALFPASVMNIAAAHTSMELGVQGYNTTVNHKEISTEMALQVAADALRLGHVGRALAGGVEELSQALHHGFRRLGGLSRSLPRPYGKGRDGICLGEGAAVLALEREDRARSRGARVLAEVAGTGAAAGPRPLVGWGPAWEAAATIGPSIEAGVAAVRAALRDADLEPADIDLVVGCGCGSPDLDRLDALVLEEALAGRAVPVTTPHGAIGSFPAAGALRLASAVEMLRAGCIYPSVSDGETDPDLPLPGLVLDGPCSKDLRRVLLLSHASGGGSAAVVLARGEG